jgi:hypothetical protein
MKPNSKLLSAIYLCIAASATADYKAVNPQVAKIISEVSEQRITEILKKLESFGTRNTFSSQDNPSRGIGAARKWIYEQFRSYSPRLEVTFDKYRLKKDETPGSRVTTDVDLYNVVAVLPGTVNREQRIIISGHYDSIALIRPTGASANPGDAPPAPSDPNGESPGVTDDGSGTACVMELARVLSVAFAGEEYGLLGSTLYAEKAHRESHVIEAVLNNDIIGSDTAGNGRTENWRVNVFSEDPADSPSRELARYIREMGMRYLPSMRADLIFRADRFGRGGDHTPFNQRGFAAVRFSSPQENFTNQHSVTDTFANTSVPYILRVTKLNAAAAASLALAPKSPGTMERIKRNGQIVPTLLLTRGKTRYDAMLRWKQENPEPDLAGYVVLMRATTAPFWEHDIFVGNVTEYTLPDVSIDEVVFGVKAVDKDGNESLVAPYAQTPRAKRNIPSY